jgi:hypothetical protein
MKLEHATRAQRVTLSLTLGLILLTMTFPWSEYEYSAGFPRGPVVWELKTHKFQHTVEDAFFIGRATYYQGFGIVPCWNIQAKRIRWDWTLTQSGIIAFIGAAAFLVNPAPRRAAVSASSIPAAPAAQAD